jgi:membrane-associated protease RseP (regulator of RpoE activity)
MPILTRNPTRRSPEAAWRSPAEAGIFGRPAGSASRMARRVMIVIVGMLAAGVRGPSAGAEAVDAPAAGGGATAVEPADAGFQPGDITIGEPIALPFAQPEAADAAAEAPADMPVSPQFQPPGRLAGPATGGTAPLPGNGWLGFSVAESAQPGRWEIATVAPGGPAAAAGIQPGDEIRAIDGLPLRSRDDVSQAMTAVAPGQQVSLAIARGEQLGDVRMTATARPRVESAWGASPANAEQPPVPAASPPAPPPAIAAPAPARAALPAVAQPAPRRPTPSTLPPVREDDASARGRTALGVRTLPVDRGLQSRFNLPQPRGAYVIGVVSDLPAARAGVPPGSVIVSLDDSPVGSPAELTQLVTAGPLGRPVTLEYVLPGGSSQRAEVILQTLEQPLEAALLGPAAATPTPVPQLQQQPQPAASTTRRPVTSFDAGAVSAMQDEIRWLRSRLDALERRLEGRSR